MKPPDGIHLLRDEGLPFISYFDPQTGYYARTGLLDAEGRDTGVDPFCSAYPQLLDVGIMGHCAHGLSGLCREARVKCYQSGADVVQPHMPLADFRQIVDQSEGRVFQFALGGRGDPDQHPDFGAILACARERGIVPNLTTSGFRLTRRHASLIRKYCGAAAVSWYRQPYTLRAIDLLLEAGVKTNIHFLLSRETIDEAIRWLEQRGWPAGINRVVFLLFKPVGQGDRASVLPLSDPRTRTFLHLFNTDSAHRHAGFDSCTVPGLVNFAPALDPRSYDACEGGRFSAYITPDMQMLPCSFDQEHRWAVDLRSHTIAEAWFSPAFKDFRSRLASACPACARRELCMGGCPIQPEIVLCDARGG